MRTPLHEVRKPRANAYGQRREESKNDKNAFSQLSAPGNGRTRKIRSCNESANRLWMSGQGLQAIRLHWQRPLI